MRSINIFKRSAALITALFALITAIAVRPAPAAAAAPAAPDTSLEEINDGRRGVSGCDPIERAALPTDDFTFVRVLITTSGTRLDLELWGGYSFENGPDVGCSGEGYGVRITLSGGVITAVSLETGEVLAEGENVVLHRNIVHYMAGYVTLAYSGNDKTKGRMYLGDFSFCVYEDKLTMINTVPMTYYIYGVVGYELNIYCQPEALKAQALAAQSFAMYYMGGTKPFDVKDGYSSAVYQAYRGFKDSRLASMPFCRAVLGEALSFNGTFYPIFYGGTNGGETALPSHLGWGTSQDPAYDVHLDPFDYESGDSIDRISVDFGGTGDNSRLLDFILLYVRDNFGADPVSVDSIDSLYVYDPVPGTTLNNRRLHIGAALTLNDEGEPELKRAARTGSESFEFDCDVSLLRSFELSDADGSGDDYSSSKYVFTHNYLIYWGEPRTDGYTLIFSRYGHGVGFSQMGAETLANPDTYGWDYHRIIEFYYPKFDLIRVSMTAPENLEDPNAVPSPTVCYGVCTVSSTALREGASIHSPSLGSVHENEHLDILNVTDSGWYNVAHNGKTGYLPVNQVSITMFPSPSDGRFLLYDGEVIKAANVRTAPTTSGSGIICKLQIGDHFTGVTQIGKWFYIIMDDGRTGFISSLMVHFMGGRYETGMWSVPLPPKIAFRISKPKSAPAAGPLN